ncbi:MAG: Imm1 family immunity protein [Xanthobacteraceae bacterium]
MIVQYCNNQDKSDRQHDAFFTEGTRLAHLLDNARTRTPFIAELRADNGFELVIGTGGDLGCVEHRRINGDLPYLMAMSSHPPLTTGEVEFLTANTPTPIAARYILSFLELKEIALDFLATGERSKSVSWEEI